MNNKIIFALLVLSLLVISACVQTTGPLQKGQEPSGVDVVGESGKKPAEGQDVEETEEVKEMSAEVKELLSIASNKVKSLRYSYKGPQTKDFFYDFFVKGKNIKYLPNPDYKILDVDEDAYDTIYINRELKTAEGYCDDRTCRVKGKKANLTYEEVYVWTPLDWLYNIEFAEKTGEELIEQRDTWKLLTGIGETIWIDTFFGVPLKVEFEGNKYRFQKMTFNDVKDEEVIPKD